MGNQKENKPGLKRFNSAVKFTGLGFQIAGTVGFATWLGYWLDNKIDTLPLFMVVLCMGSLFGNIYLLIKSGKKDE